LNELSHHPAALEELVEAVNYYLLKASHDVALRFDARVDEGTKAIQAHPRRYPVWRKTRARRYIVPNFPYVIFYMEWPGTVRVLAVAHTSRRPGYWKSRITVA
jgi:toxin ParE1/3/4